METNEEQTTSYPSKEQIEQQLAEFCEVQDVPPWGEAHVSNRLDDMASYVYKLVADALEAAAIETEPIKTLTYAPNVRNGVYTGHPEGFTEKQWHQDAAADTGTSHNLAGRLYVVQCEWCPRAFAAQSKAGAVAMFRAHEAEMFEPLPVEGESNA